MRSRRGRMLAAGGGVLAVVIAASACAAAPPTDAWILTPLSYDNRLDGVGSHQIVDTTYPMALTSDTAGGFWGFAAGSWLHIDATGTAVARFNLFDSGTHGAIAAQSPTVLVVAASESHDGRSSIRIFDTEAGTWSDLHRDERALGGIAAVDDRVYVVARAADARVCTVEMLDLRETAAPIAVSPEFECEGPVAVAADQTRIFIATEDERIIVDAEGQFHSREPVESAHPGVAVNNAGDVAWSGQDAPRTALPVFVDGGSGEARAIIERHDICDPEEFGIGARGLERLSLASPHVADPVTLSFLCAPVGFAWINDDELVVSIGNEGGAVLVRVAPPVGAR